MSTIQQAYQDAKKEYTTSDLPSATSLKDLAIAPFDTKTPIESICYKNWKSFIGDRVDDHFNMMVLMELVARVYHISVSLL
ncbi:9595_t:CDS:2 [Paraglomus occultum]|uniref:9595_t:CDS:1 n=1 Tax=Paraglomus occultum TaxID=144539 RepID=A0A9N9BVR7_9GLOM|nr:9595_t:CDS:2 [Paraglomus occultum]